MHESTQRLLCRIGFVALCLAPTLYVAGWAAAVNTPQYESLRRQQWESLLSQRLGLQTAIGKISQASRGVTLLQDVQLSLPEAQAPLVEIRVVELRRYQDGWLVSASQVEADASDLPNLWSILHDRLMVRGPEAAAPIWFRCSELTLQGGAVEQTLAAVSAKYHAPSGSPELLVQFGLPEDSGDEPCQLAIRRARQQRPALTTVRLDTQGAALPCSVLGGSISLVDLMGEKTKFRGELELRQESGGAFSGRISEAEFLEVETQRLLSACSLHTFRTRASLHIESAEFHQGHLKSIVGGVAAEFGVIDAHFIRALHREMQIAVPDGLLDATNEKISFTQLAFDFALDAQDGLYLQGSLGEQSFQGAMMSGSGGPILLQPQRPHVTAVSLIRALAPQNDVQAPATQQTRQLVNVLPVPDIARAAPDRPRASLKIRKTH